MQVNTVEKLASVGAFGLWAALHGWLGWLAVLYAICMLLDCVTGTALAVKEKTWNSSKARKGLWHKGGSTIMICVSVLTDIFLGLVINHHQLFQFLSLLVLPLEGTILTLEYVMHR